ncbi:MAG: metal ABC transporter permease [Gemmataceae bacterium]|nr:metal ABC transporter permease [Gemmataceae bacterium]MDW8242868.1 metal ABC transporter permease [Thermogemmata sp.]
MAGGWDTGLWTVATGTAFLGASAGLAGSFAVLRRQSLQGDVVAHAALAGVAVAFLAGGRGPLPLLVGGALAGWLTLRLADAIHRQTRLPLDALQGGIMAVGFGLGLALLKHITSHVADAGRHPLDRYLLGQAAQLRESDVYLIALVLALSIFLLAALWKYWKLLAFDGEFAAALGLPVRWLEMSLTAWTVTVVVVGLKAAGVVLITALLVAPAVAARQWTDRLGLMVCLAGLFGALAGGGGTLLAHYLEQQKAIPTGPAIVLCASGWVAVSLLWARARLGGRLRRTLATWPGDRNQHP